MRTLQPGELQKLLEQYHDCTHAPKCSGVGCNNAALVMGKDIASGAVYAICDACIEKHGVQEVRRQ